MTISGGEGCAAGPRASARGAAAVVVVTGAAVLLLLAVPAVRPAAVVGAAWTTVALLVAGTLWHRPRDAWQWWALVVSLTAWSTSITVVQVEGRVPPLGVALLALAQLAAFVVAVTLLPWPGRARSRRPPRARATRVLDATVVVVVVGLVLAQAVATAATGSARATTVVVSLAVDVAILGLLLAFVFSHRVRARSGHLLVAAGVTTILFDLLSGIHGSRVALPGDTAQALGVTALLFGAAALHPSMTEVFRPPSPRSRRAPSGALLGLLPLMAVPVALWAVARASGATGLPTEVLLAGASLAAVLCLVRASLAMRGGEHSAEHDPLTDLVNRRGLERLFDSSSSPGGWALLLVDLDSLTKVNDAFGHAVGDALLRRVGDRLRAVVGPAGVVARLGGDEFVVLARAGQARAVAEEVLRVNRPTVGLGEHEMSTSVSLGLADADPRADLDELLTRADIALSLAKSGGRDRCVPFTPQMREDVLRRHRLTTDLQRLLDPAVPGYAGQLVVHQQPLVELAGDRTVGAEALVRWQHPELGLLPPDAFLPLVSAASLDSALDDAVLRQVLHQLARWRSEGRATLPVSVNLTTSSLLDPCLDDRVLDLLALAGVPAAMLHLEVTEHEELPADGPAGRTLRRLREAGVAVHLDDFGRGYTSLSYLRRFPVEVLKLDKSVVDSVTTPVQRRLVAGIVAMASTLGLDLLAEGVETTEQRDALLALGVRYGQGYLFSRPLPAADFAEQALGPPAHQPSAAVPPRPRRPLGEATAPHGVLRDAPR
ncbi:putative bifunctional diguanylate cyclase/phosphodiesterase [Pseudokineococcus sp. 1T1Z-3]|uniref:putative bifunctional diguanylate cyclase/phosphodiesterase n=1 Tax=Pseudokineococcus sp. 1T1Z-3 TaxID=3132745 RepID=UPI0030AA6E08